MTFGIFSVLFAVAAVVMLAYMIGKFALGCVWVFGNIYELVNAWRLDRRESKYERRRWR